MTRSSAAAVQAAARLVDLDILVKEAAGYRYDDPFLRGWVVLHGLPDAGVSLPAHHVAG